MFTNCGSFNEGAVVNGNTDETSIIIRCSTHQVNGIQIRWSLMHYEPLFMFINRGSFNEGAVVSGNIDETSIIRCNSHQAQMHTN